MYDYSKAISKSKSSEMSSAEINTAHHVSVGCHTPAACCSHVDFIWSYVTIVSSMTLTSFASYLHHSTWKIGLMVKCSESKLAGNMLD